jgi:DNA repair protein RadC
LQYTIEVNANAIIICHNHPRVNLRPSAADIKLTRKVKDAAILMDIQVLDHLIIIPEGRYYSMADEGVL